MSVEKTLSKVDADLAARDVAMAVQRLRGLVGSFPDRFDLRERLGHTYRLLGDQVQAGRWTYLADDRAPAEVAAFEKATADPVDRMRALRWTAAPDLAPTAVGRERLAALLKAAQMHTRDPDLTYAELGTDRWIQPERMPPGEKILVILCLLVVGLFILGMSDGLRVLVRWAL